MALEIFGSRRWKIKFNFDGKGKEYGRESARRRIPIFAQISGGITAGNAMIKMLLIVPK
jgi:hypothetical protein